MIKQLPGEIIVYCLGEILRPVVRFCIRRGIKIQELHELAKIIFVQESRAEAERIGEKFNSSRCSTMTGIHRRDVNRIKSQDKPKLSSSLVTRVVGLWQNSKKYTDSKGKPRKLSYGFDNSDFSKLVRDVYKDVHPSSVLTELIRSGIIKEKNSELILSHKIFNPQRDYKQGMELLAADGNDLINVVEHNIFNENEPAHHHVRTEYDNIPLKEYDNLRSWLMQKAEKLHAEVRKKLSHLDRDIQGQKNEEASIKVSYGSYAWIQLQKDIENED